MVMWCYIVCFIGGIFAIWWINDCFIVQKDWKYIFYLTQRGYMWCHKNWVQQLKIWYIECYRLTLRRESKFMTSRIIHGYEHMFQYTIVLRDLFLWKKNTNLSLTTLSTNKLRKWISKILLSTVNKKL